VINTFGLGCCYDPEKAYQEMKRVLKKGGKLILLEKGLGCWLFENWKIARLAKARFGARGEIYH